MGLIHTGVSMKKKQHIDNDKFIISFIFSNCSNKIDGMSTYL